MPPLLPMRSGPSAALSRPPPSGSEDPSHKIPTPTPDRAPSLWERPWPRHGRRGPQVSIKAAIASKLAPTAPHPAPRTTSAAVGVRRLLPQNPCSDPGSGAIPVGATLAATRPSWAAGFDARCSRGQKTPPTEPPPRRRPRVWLSPCGSGLGRDTAVPGRRLRCRPPSGSEDPAHKVTAPTKCPAELAALAFLGSHPRSSPGEHP